MKKYLILSKSKYEMKLALLEDNKLDVMYIERFFDLGNKTKFSPLIE